MDRDNASKASRIVVTVERRDLRPTTCAACRGKVYLARIGGASALVEFRGVDENNTAILSAHRCEAAVMAGTAGDRRKKGAASGRA